MKISRHLYRIHSTTGYYLLLLALCFWSCTLYAQRTKIFGLVRDAEGSPIELATIRIAGQPIMTLSNLKGEYTLFCQQSDSVLVVFSQIGYGPRRKLILKPTDSVRIDMVLHKSEGQIGTAVVTGRRKQTGTTQQISTKALENLPSTSGNAVEELIQSQAGVSTHNELSSQYNVRGGSFDENVVYLNGTEIFRPFLVRSGQQEGLSIINPDMVDRIFFSSGGFEARYGDKMSSVLDITYKHPRHFEGKISGSMLGGSAYVGWGNKKISFMGSVRYKTTQYLLGTLDTHGEYKPRFTDYQGFLSWHPSKKWSVDLLGNISDNHYNFVPQDRTTSFGTINNPKTFKVYFDGQEKDYFKTYFGSANITRHFSSRTFASILFSAFNTHEREFYDINGEYWLQESTINNFFGIGKFREHARNMLNANVFSIGLNFRTQTKDKGEHMNNHTLLMGLNFRKEYIIDYTKEWEMRDSMGYSLPVSTEGLNMIYSLEGDSQMKTHRWEGFAQDTWRISTHSGLFNLTYGLRWSLWSWNKESLFSPRLSIGFLPAKNDRWTLRFATGFYYQTPFFKEVQDTTRMNGMIKINLNKNIKAQRSIHFVCGADYTFNLINRPFKFTTELYYKLLSRLNPYSVNNLRVEYYGQNIATGYVAGIDFKLYGEFVPGTDSWITFSLMKAQQKIGNLSIPQPTDQRFNLSLFFTDYFPGSTRWRGSLKMAFAGGLPFTVPHSNQPFRTFRAPAYKRVDFGLSYRIPLKWQRREKLGLPVSKHHVIKNIWLGLDAFNLLGIDNINSYYWVTDVTNVRYAVPNYLTGRQINFKFSVEF